MSGSGYVPGLTGLLEADPDLMTRLKARARAEMFVLGRRVVMDVDDQGCRPVCGQPAAGEKTVALYGCSCTYGIALPAEETFCSLLQSMFPTWRVENHGVSGYGTVQNLLSLRRNSRWAPADYVTFCWIPDHLLRNVAAFSCVLDSMEGAPSDLPSSRWPRAGLDAEGNLDLRSIAFPRFDLSNADLSAFRPDPHYLDLVCAAVMRRAADIVAGCGGHFFVTTLHGNLSAKLHGMLHEGGIPVLDIGLEGIEYLCLPDDPHPNAAAARIFAERIRDYLLRVQAE
jgi:hypothetical protein